MYHKFFWYFASFDTEVIKLQRKFIRTDPLIGELAIDDIQCCRYFFLTKVIKKEVKKEESSSNQPLHEPTSSTSSISSTSPLRQSTILEHCIPTPPRCSIIKRKRVWNQDVETFDNLIEQVRKIYFTKPSTLWIPINAGFFTIFFF